MKLKAKFFGGRYDPVQGARPLPRTVSAYPQKLIVRNQRLREVGSQMKHETQSVSSGSAPPLSDAERTAIQEMGRIEKVCRLGALTKDEALRRIAKLVADDDERIAQEKKARR